MSLSSEPWPAVAMWATALSLALLLASAVLVPILVARLPEDWLLPDAAARRHAQHPALHVALTLARNALGAFLLVAGVLMLVLPGQGVLTLLLGLALVDLPGKHHALVRLLAVPGAAAPIQWLRRKAGKPPLRLPEA